MNNFKPGGIRNRKEFMGGRPKSDANYGPKKFDRDDRGGDRGGNRGNDRGGSRGGFGGGNRGGDRRETEMFKTTCTTCGKPAEVPFRPDGSKPVLCSTCFSAKRDAEGDFNPRERGGSERFERKERSFDAPKERTNAPTGPDFSILLKQVAALEVKVNELLEIIKAQSKAVKSAPVAKTEPVVERDAEPQKAPAAKKAVKKVAKVVKKAAPKKVAKKAVKKTK